MKLKVCYVLLLLSYLFIKVAGENDTATHKAKKWPKIPSFKESISMNYLKFGVLSVQSECDPDKVEKLVESTQTCLEKPWQVYNLENKTYRTCKQFEGAGRCMWDFIGKSNATSAKGCVKVDTVKTMKFYVNVTDTLVKFICRNYTRVKVLEDYIGDPHGLCNYLMYSFVQGCKRKYMKARMRDPQSCKSLVKLKICIDKVMVFFNKDCPVDSYRRYAYLELLGIQLYFHEHCILVGRNPKTLFKSQPRWSNNARGNVWWSSWIILHLLLTRLILS